MRTYETIRRWGKMVRSYPYFVESEIKKAQIDNAPADAIYKRGNTWHRAKDIVDDNLRKRIMGK